ncbi:hypothetical protein SNE40_016345 [Patella caerulea]|uniref:Beta-1,3-galactosyl-O-glycosyl-glycoprotein beta-1,6-N-acetylglucosaminyltransferase n=2 Tax=Patella caerulea TaxID=87958 RepID=A0AAN8JDE7_PATCE
MEGHKRPRVFVKFLAVFLFVTLILILYYNNIERTSSLSSTLFQHRPRPGRLKFLSTHVWSTNIPTNFTGKIVKERSGSDGNTRKHSVVKRKSFNYTFNYVETVNCKKMLKGNKPELDRAKSFLSNNYRNSISNTWYFVKTKNCDSFISERGYVTDSLTSEERDFPIAYSILMFKDVEQFERLLRAIYRPQNYYCIHVDAKAAEDVYNAVRGIVGCLDNVFMTRKYVDVQWGTFSVLEPELICMKMLFKYKNWKYFINLTGQEFPLKTNYELVKILETYNGANDMEGTVRRANKARWSIVGVSPPHNIRPVKGSVHIVVNRDFVDYVLNNKTAIDFLEWVKNVDVPDETYFSSLNHNPHLGIPGSYKGIPETTKDKKPFLARFKNWGREPFDWPCKGKRVRLICIFGVGDLPLLSRRKEMFANKFYLNFEPFALDCLEELHHNKTRDEYLGLVKFNTSYYQGLDFIKNKV